MLLVGGTVKLSGHLSQFLAKALQIIVKCYVAGT